MPPPNFKTMRPNKYNSYSTSLKLACIKGENISGINPQTEYYWLNKGKGRIESTVADDRLVKFIESMQDSRSRLKQLLTDLFKFFMKIIEHKPSVKRSYRKQRTVIIELIEQIRKFDPNLTNVCDLFGITERTYYNWKNKPVCKMTYTKECPNIYPGQLTDNERRILEKEYFDNEKYADYSVADLFAQMLRDEKIVVCEGLFYELARFRGETEKRKIKYQKVLKEGIRADKPGALIHMDKTLFKNADGTRSWASLICDNKSRCILGHILHSKCGSVVTLANLKSVINKHELDKKPFMLLTDDGSENKGAVKQYTSSNKNIDHRIGQITIDFSNSMIESVIKQIKYRFLKKKTFKNFEELSSALNTAVENYNTRPRKMHLGKTALEVFNGQETDLSELKERKEQARLKRLEDNRIFNCLKAYYNTVQEPDRSPDER